MLLHLFFGAEHDGVRRAGPGAGRTLTHSDAVRAKRALVGFVVDRGDARNVEGTAFDAIAAADAFIVIEVDDAVGILHDRAGCRARLQTARIFAMHAAVLADKPFQILALWIDPFGKPHHRE